MTVRKTITIPKETFDFGRKRAAKIAKDNGQFESFSRYIAGLIAADRKNHTKQNA